MTTLDVRIGGRYQVGRKLGAGGFGELLSLEPGSLLIFSGDIYVGRDTVTGEEVAIKLEAASIKHSQLAPEAEVYRGLAGGVGAPLMRFYAKEKDYTALVMDLL